MSGEERLRGHQSHSVEDKLWPEPEPRWMSPGEEQIKIITRQLGDNVGYRSTVIQMASLYHKLYHSGEFYGFN